MSSPLGFRGRRGTPEGDRGEPGKQPRRGPPRRPNGERASFRSCAAATWNPSAADMRSLPRPCQLGATPSLPDEWRGQRQDPAGRIGGRAGLAHEVGHHEAGHRRQTPARAHPALRGCARFPSAKVEEMSRARSACKSPLYGRAWSWGHEACHGQASMSGTAGSLGPRPRARQRPKTATMMKNSWPGPGAPSRSRPSMVKATARCGRGRACHARPRYALPWGVRVQL